MAAKRTILESNVLMPSYYREEYATLTEARMVAERRSSTSDDLIELAVMNGQYEWTIETWRDGKRSRA